MDAVELVGWILAVVAAGIAVYFRLTGKSESDQLLLEKFYRYQSTAREAVAAAEQLWRTGQIPEADGVKDPRFVWAAERLEALFPQLSDEALEMTIEAAVFWLKGGVERWMAAKDVAPPEVPEG